jgi:hypothetical protein
VLALLQKMSIQAAKEELSSLTTFQRDIHVANHASEEIISHFYKAFIKSTWYSSVPMKLKCTSDGEETVYTVNNSFHYLIYSYMRFQSPPVRVKPEFKGRVRIAWCHNLGTNIVSQAVFKEDDDTYQTWDSVWADIYFQFYQDNGAGKRENHNIYIGNIPCLEEWTDFLPACPINVDQPWFYSMDNSLAFPIFYKNSQTRAEHRYTFRRRITDLLRMQFSSKDGKWKSTTKSLHKYLDIGQTATIKIPELWGRYAYVSEAEISYHKCDTERVFFTRDVEICDTPNPNQYKTTAEISLHCVNPCLAFFWVAENRDAISNHNYSNYTTNADDLHSGWDPIRTTSLKYGTTIRLDNMPSDHFSAAECRKHFRSAPSERGFHGYSFAADSTNYHGDIGVVLAELHAKLHCTINDNNIFTMAPYEDDDDDKEEDDIAESLMEPEAKSRPDIKSESSTEGEPSPSFITRTRLLVVRKFTVSTAADGEWKFKIQ